jgi:glucose/arabinose dehydrogenase
MECQMRRFIFFPAIIGVAACMEPQIAPDLPKLDISNLNVEVIAEGLNHPWSVAADGGGRYYVTERGGKLFQITKNSRTEITGLPGDIYVEGQAGLFDVVLPSDFVRSDKIYLTYA